jgi:hypothetical protein
MGFFASDLTTSTQSFDVYDAVPTAPYSIANAADLLEAIAIGVYPILYPSKLINAAHA